MQLEIAKQRAFRFYRNHKVYLAKLEKQYLETPTSDLRDQCAERRGILRGIELCWDAIEERINDNEFQFSPAEEESA